MQYLRERMHWRVLKSIVLIVMSIPVVVIIGMLFILTADCGPQGTWYRWIEDRVPIAPMPADTIRMDAGTLLHDLEPHYSSTSVSSSYERAMYLTNTKVADMVAFYQQLGSECTLVTRMDRQLFSSYGSLPTWECTRVPMIPWERGTVEIATFPEFSTQVRALDMDTVDPETYDNLVRWRRALGDAALPSATTPLSSTVLLVSTIWCETP